MGESAGRKELLLLFPTEQKITKLRAGSKKNKCPEPGPAPWACRPDLASKKKNRGGREWVLLQCWTPSFGFLLLGVLCFLYIYFCGNLLLLCLFLIVSLLFFSFSCTFGFLCQPSQKGSPGLEMAALADPLLGFPNRNSIEKTYRMETLTLKIPKAESIRR